MPKQIYIPLLLIFLPVIVFAQKDQDKLEQKRKSLESEIAYTNKLLKETKSSKEATLNELKLLDVKLNKRSDLIATIDSEIYQLNDNIERTKVQLRKLNENLDELKIKYTEIAWHAYKYKTSYNKLIFIFSADDLNQAYQRMRYLDQLSTYIRTEAEIINKAEVEKNILLEDLKGKKRKKGQLLSNEQAEIIDLEKEQSQKSKLKKNLQSRERQLKKAKREKEKQTAALDRQIQKIILSETSAKKDKPGNKTYALTPSEMKLSSSFASNRGKLPWPTERGIISGTYGVHQHPVLKKVKVKNNGIDIATSKNSEARAVFNGKVVSITKISNTNLAVIIKHGEYFTVYSNLDKVFVKKDDNIITKELIGQIHTDLKGNTELHFEVWKGSALQNPTYWVVKK